MAPNEQEIAALRAELEATRRQLTEAHQMAAIGRLLASIVHEINTPIGSIFSNNEVLRRSLENLKKSLAGPEPSMDKARRIADTIESLAGVDRIACERIASVIRGLKSLSRVDAPELRKADINAGLKDTLKLTQAEFRRRVTVETDFGELPEVECYPQMLNQVFLNILVNAGQAIEDTGTIKVQSRLEGECVHVIISDTGRGMRPEQLARIFEAGYTTKAIGVGSGLGLSIAREIVEDKHRGRIQVESQPGVGTTFHIVIPVSHARQA